MWVNERRILSVARSSMKRVASEFFSGAGPLRCLMNRVYRRQHGSVRHTSRPLAGPRIIPAGRDGAWRVAQAGLLPSDIPVDDVLWKLPAIDDLASRCSGGRTDFDSSSSAGYLRPDRSRLAELIARRVSSIHAEAGYSQAGAPWKARRMAIPFEASNRPCSNCT